MHDLLWLTTIALAALHLLACRKTQGARGVDFLALMASGALRPSEKARTRGEL